MANDVKWIKITTDIFDDEKILLIESLPDSYAIITCWFKLLCLAGKQNNSGVFMIGRIAYTDKMLATIFRMKESTVTMALQTFEQFGMVEIVDGVITIPNWGKHQNLDQLEAKKEYMRNYMAEYRAKQKAITSGEANCKTNSKANVSSAEKEEEKERDKEKEYHSFNQSAFSDSDLEENEADPAERERTKRRFLGGSLGKGVVLLSDEQIDSLLDLLSVEEFNHYVSVIAAKELQGHHYKRKTHYDAIKDMAIKDRKI